MMPIPRKATLVRPGVATGDEEAAIAAAAATEEEEEAAAEASMMPPRSSLGFRGLCAGDKGLPSIERAERSASEEARQRIDEERTREDVQGGAVARSFVDLVLDLEEEAAARGGEAAAERSMVGFFLRSKQHLRRFSWRAEYSGCFAVFVVLVPSGRAGDLVGEEKSERKKETSALSLSEKSRFFFKGSVETSDHAVTRPSLSTLRRKKKKTRFCLSTRFARFRNRSAASLLFLCVPQVRSLSPPLPRTKIRVDRELRGGARAGAHFMNSLALLTRSAVAASTVDRRPLTTRSQPDQQALRFAFSFSFKTLSC